MGTFHLRNLSFIRYKAYELGFNSDDMEKLLSGISYEKFPGVRVGGGIFRIWEVEFLGVLVRYRESADYEISVVDIRKRVEDGGVSFKTLQPLRKYLEIFDNHRKQWERTYNNENINAIRPLPL